MPRAAMTHTQRKAHVARKAAKKSVTSKLPARPIVEDKMISAPIADGIFYWQLVMKRRPDGVSAHAIFRDASKELHDFLKIDASVHPGSKEAAKAAVDAALKQMAEDNGISADEAQETIEGRAGTDDEENDERDNEGDTGDGKKREPKQAEILMGEAQAAKLFHTPKPDSEEYADITIDGHRETHRIRGKGFRQWLRHQYFLKMKKGCSAEAMQVAIETIAAWALFEGEEREVHCRVAEHEGAIYIDLGDPKWRAIEVTEFDWKVIDEPPVRFRRSPSTRALPIPEPGGSIKLLQPFCNVKSDDEFVLLVAHMLAVLRPNANYPVLVITGEQGACKSTLVRLIVRLTDPRVPEQRSLPDSQDDLITAAKGAHLLSYDNISGMPDWLSDAICRLSTGGGAGKRKLYSDDDEILFSGRRPVIVNGIEDVVTRADLVDRAIMLMLEAIPESKRREEKEIDAAFEKAVPKIFGTLLDGLVAGLENLTIVEVSITDMPRMADFSVWAEACTSAYWPAGTFLRAYRECLAGSVELVIDSSPVASAVQLFMLKRSGAEWAGTASELLPRLSDLIGEVTAKEREWPKRANTLVNKLRRAAPALRKIGIHIAFAREGHASRKLITISTRTQPEQKAKTSSAPPASPAEPKKPDETSATRAVDTVDRVSMAVDHAVDAVGLAVDERSVTSDGIDRAKPLENNDAVDAVDAVDLSGICSGERAPHPFHDPSFRVCLQCQAGPRTEPPADAPTIRAEGGWLHDGPCKRFWSKQHPGGATGTVSK